MKQLWILVSILLLAAACAAGTTISTPGCSWEQEICVDIAVVEPVVWGEWVEVIITVTATNDTPNQGIGIGSLSGIVMEGPKGWEAETRDWTSGQGGGSWTIDLKANQPAVFTRRIYLPPRELSFTLRASLLTLEGQYVVDSVYIDMSRAGGTVRYPGTPHPNADSNEPALAGEGTPPVYPCLVAADGGFVFYYFLPVDNGDGSVTLMYEVANPNEQDISYVAFGTVSGRPLAPTDGITTTLGLGDYQIEWTGERGNPGFPSVKFETQFDGFSQGALERFTLQVADFDPYATLQAEAKAGGKRGRVDLDADCYQVERATPTPPVSPLPIPTPTAAPETPVSPLPTPTG